jgi:hypothetical protein
MEGVGTSQHAVTGTEYLTLQQAFDYFNHNLFLDAFGNLLPPCLITYQRDRTHYGYFTSARFQHRREPHVRTDEIALNPDGFHGRSDKEILSTLVHEMVHCHQAHYGKPGRGRYHNQEWAEQMEAVGLMPSTTGQPGGQKTGEKVSHYILASGLFTQVVQELCSAGLHLNWQSGFEKNKSVGGLSRPSRNKTKFSCARCGQNAWAKPTAHLICGACQWRMTPSWR